MRHFAQRLRSSCQTKALNPDASGQDTRPKRRQCAMPSLAHPALGTSCAVVPVAWPAEHIRRPRMV
ncbi:hypothetical protein [Desulfosporosinus sp. Sb-LF]|uniref:hypothetical protein n=1 Tax=Desulfosporosinus sp. Sb-LF TaxID=2560027 RepID=UPI00107F7AFA|nr:hypothetical protein [Desulfosporosinus sp. Sb-LF]TGE31980.1 hypothetical protein E4K68_14985 [Desulfosporosinus sp. Sb-LF]